MMKKNFFQKYAVYLIVPFILIMWWLFKKTKGFANLFKSNLDNSAITTAVNMTSSNIQPGRATEIQNIADEIHSCFHSYFFGMFENERGAIEAFNRLLNASEAVLCATIYKASFKKSLYTEFQKYLLGIERSDLKQTNYEAIKNI